MTKVKNDKKNMSMCICGKCPSYNDCAKKKHEGFFCALGKSSCTIKMNGCQCGSCPVFKANNLNTGYFCMNGAAN